MVKPTSDYDHLSVKPSADGTGRWLASYRLGCSAGSCSHDSAEQALTWLRRAVKYH